MDLKHQQVFAQRLAAYAPEEWSLIPDLGLYMDQVITYLGRQLKPVYPGDEKVFTPAMVNNYVKMGLVSRPNGKKYGREQLAQLLMICLLKQSASAGEMKALLTPAPGEDVQALYLRFCQTQKQTFGELASELPLDSALSCGVKSAAYRLLLADILSAPDAPKPEEEDAPQ